MKIDDLQCNEDIATQHFYDRIFWRRTIALGQWRLFSIIVFPDGTSALRDLFESDELKSGKYQNNHSCFSGA